MIPTRAVDDRAGVLLVKARLNVRRGAALRAVAGDQQPGCRHLRAQHSQLFGISRTGDCADDPYPTCLG